MTTIHQPIIPQDALTNACNDDLLTSGSKSMQKETLQYGAISTGDDSLEKSKYSRLQENVNVEGNQKLTFSKLSPQKKCTFLMLCVASFGTGCGFSLPAPFFPSEAAKKGVSPSVVGMVFSSFELAMVLGAPLFGTYLTHIGAKFMYTSGILVAGVCSILFGFLDGCPPGESFIVLSFLLRVVEGFAVMAFFIASQAVITHAFPHNVATAIAVQETFLGIGMMVGPTIGGALFEVGGFGLPFWVIGVFIMVSGMTVMFCLPPPEDQQQQQGSIFSLLRSPRVCVTLLVIFAGPCGMGFLQPTLSHHLETFGLSPAQVGLSFAIVPCILAIMSPVWGVLMDKFDIPSPVLMAGGALSGMLAFLFVGPSPLLSFLPRELWCVFVGLVLFGFTFGCSIVPTVPSILVGARDLGLPDNLELFGLISGLFNTVFCFGYFIGPTLGGVLVEHLPFGHSATYMAVMFLFVLVVTCSFFGGGSCRQRMG